MSMHHMVSRPNEPIQVEQFEPYQPRRLLPCFNKVRNTERSKECTVAEFDSRSVMPQESRKHQCREDKPNQPFQDIEPVIADRESKWFLSIIGPPNPDKYDLEQVCHRGVAQQNCGLEFNTFQTRNFNPDPPKLANFSSGDFNKLLSRQAKKCQEKIAAESSTGRAVLDLHTDPKCEHPTRPHETFASKGDDSYPAQGWGNSVWSRVLSLPCVLT
jgi:hypothetical protein